MYIRSIKFQRVQEGQWEKGYYVAKYDGSNNSVVLDQYYQPVTGSIWNYVSDYINYIIININEIDED